jgi:hypothetical protein
VSEPIRILGGLAHGASPTRVCGRRVGLVGSVRCRYQAGLVGGDDELYPVPGAQLGQQPGYVGLGGARGDVQGGGDLGVGHAEAHQLEDLAFAVGDLGELPGLGVWTGLASELRDQAAGDAGGDDGVAGRDDADRGQDVFRSTR